MTKIFIDTNIFHGLYYSNNDNLAIFKDINKFQPHLVIPEQINDEFVRNRDSILQSLIKDIKKTYACYPCSSSLIQGIEAYKNVKKIKTDLNECKKSIISELTDMLLNSKKDPIFLDFQKIYTNDHVIKIPRTSEIVENAKNRKLIGNPPISLDKDTIGDEIIWESLLSHIRDDLIILTRDGTYKNHITF